MAFDINTKANIAFKQIKAKAHTSNNRDPVNEPFVTRPLVTNRDIWAQPITPQMDVATAVSEGIIGDATRVDLELEPIAGTNDEASEYSAYTLKVPSTVPAGLSGYTNPVTGAAYASGDRVTNIILEAYSNSNFRVELYSDSGKTNQIFPLDASDWTIDPVAGILVQETDVPANMNDLSNGILSCYVYVGATAETATSTAGSTSLDLAYDNDSGDRVVNVDDGDVDFQLDGYNFTVSDSTGSTDYLSVSASEIVATTDLDVQGLKSDNVTTAIPFDQAGVTGLSTNFTATSLVGAVNESRDDLTTLIDTTLPAVADGAAGADQIGVTGITGIIPEGGTLGADGTVQSMLEGIAKAAGGLKAYADEAAFTSAITGGVEYLPVDTLVYIKDTDRFAVVTVEGDATEGTGWDYLWGANQPFGGSEFNVTSGAVTIDTAGALDVDAASATLDAGGAHIGLTVDGQVDVDAVAGQMVQVTSDTEVEIDGGALVDIDGDAVTIDGATTITGGVNNAITLTTTGTGDIFLNSESEIDVNSPATFFRGDVSVDSGYQISTDKINITSVDPTDFATITGQRTGIPFTGNLLVNPGFESGLTGNADDWTEVSNTGRNSVEKYYDNYSMQYLNLSELGGINQSLTQALTGLNVTTHIASLWFKGTAQSAVEVVLNGGTPATIVPAGTTNTAWTRYNVDVTPGASDGDFVIQVNGSPLDSNNFFVDAVQLEEGNGAPSGFFSTYQSELIMRIGNNAEDKISFQSQAPEGGSISELMAIDNTQVRIYGDLVVDGTQTIVNSTEIDIGDERISLLANQTDASAGEDAFFEVNRGSDGDVALKWNETTDRWELTNDGSVYQTIMTTSGSNATLSMDVAYDGGSAVTVDNTNVDFALAATKAFIVSDGIDASKFAVNAGSGLDSVAIQTTGGLDIDAGAGVTIDGDTVITGATQVVGAMDLDGAIDHDGASFDSNVSGAFSVTAGTDVTVGAVNVDVNATGTVTLDGVGASNFTTDGGSLTLSTTTSGGVVIDSVGTLTFNDSIQTSAIAFSETDADGFSSNFVHTAQTQFNWTARSVDSPASIMAAINANRDDLYEYVELIATQGAALGVASGANLIGVDGITGIVPERVGASAGDDGTLQEILEGIAKSAGGLKSYADEAAFTSAKAGGEYLPVDTLFYLKDSDRFGIVLAESTTTVEGTDWDYLWGANQPFAGDDFVITSGAVTVNTAGALDLDAASADLDTTGAISFDAGAASNFTANGNLTLSTTSGNVVLNSAATVDVDGATVDIDSLGQVDINAGTDSDVNIAANGTGQIALAGASEVDITASLIDINGEIDHDGTAATFTTSGAFTVAATGAVDVDGSQVNLAAAGGSLDISATGAPTLTAATGQTTTVTSDTEVEIDGGALVDIDGDAVTIDGATTITGDLTQAGGTFSLTGNGTSSVTTDSANLSLGTTTSGDVAISSAGALTFDDQYAGPIAFSEVDITGLPGGYTSILGAIDDLHSNMESSNTLDEIYDGETGSRVVTMDNGSVEWRVTDTYEFNVGDSTGVDILSVKALSAGDEVEINGNVDVNGVIVDIAASNTGASAVKIDSAGGVDIDTDAGFTVNDDSGSAFTMADSGAVTLSAEAAQTLTLSGQVVDVDANLGQLSLASSATSADAVHISTSAGGIDIDSSAGFTIDAASLSLDATSASNLTVTNANLTLSTLTGGDVIVTSAGTVNVDGTVGEFDFTGNSHFNVTGAVLTLGTTTSGDVTVSSAGELYFGDTHTSANIPFADSANTSLPGGSTSILGALNTAYEKSIDMDYQEVNVTSTDVTNDYVVIPDPHGIMPQSLSFPATPSNLRGNGWYIAVYLNGLRQADTEWNYTYNAGARITFDGTDNVTLVSGDKVMVEVRKIN